MPHTYSRPLDVHRWSDYPELNDCLTDLVQQIDALKPRQRARKVESAKRLRNAVRSLVLDLYVAWKTDPQLEVGVPLSNRAFVQGSRYRALFLKYKGFVTAYHGLHELGYIEEVRPGFNDTRTGKSFVTRARATPKLIETLSDNALLRLTKIHRGSGEYAAETIILRDHDKHNIDYDDTNETNQMRNDLSRINALLDGTWIDLYITDNEYEALSKRIRDKVHLEDQSLIGLDLTRRQLVRIFNNSDWQQGGRFYGGWWQNIPRGYRKYITLDGKHTCEIDFSGMHVALLYAEVGAELDGDAYDVGCPQVPRQVTKLAFQKLINAENRMYPEPGFTEGKYGITWGDLLEKIRTRHAPISSYLRTGYGRQLQNKDAEIANRILLLMADMGIPCLPVHDSFIAHQDMREELTGIMIQEFARKTGQKAATKNKLTFLDSYSADMNTNHGTYLDMDIGNILDSDNHYYEYQTRQIAWFDQG
ncbi:hypothetical protein K1W69_18390 [Hoeflea sp. WL0058]|uniref:Uncharacterized protein n=1 Tax=Flavimaribacter sediminis TaxID=2865987 RepID=A0AAE3D2T4_9HYPH|nr:hypothetical protein [Flavimaribacter sediminis]MBW8639171.1 hypothetical protein [Flavimaribacter sediminis]